MAGDTMTGPLEGIRVADLSWVVAGPSVTRVLADFGATVVRVESRSRPDTARVMQPFHGGEFGIESSALYGTCNAGKWDLAVDLGTQEGRGVIRDLALWADVLVESFSPGTLSKWGLGPSDMREANPGLIYLSSSLMGQIGPLSSLAGFGNVGASVSGFQALVGLPGELPTGPYGPYTDYVAPKLALAALLAALVSRKTTGQGVAIDMSQVEAGLFFLSPEIAAYSAGGEPATAQGNSDFACAPHGVYRCRSTSDLDSYIAIAVRHEDDWRSLTDVIGRADLSHLTSVETRRTRIEELDGVIESWTRDRFAQDAEDELQSRGIPAYVALSAVDYPTDAQIVDRGHLRTLPHPLFGTTTVEGPRFLLSATPGGPQQAAPRIGQHSEWVLREILGYSQEHIDHLMEHGIVEQESEGSR